MLRRDRRPAVRRAFSAALALLAAPALAAEPDPELSLILRGQTAKAAVIERLVAALDLRPGMTVLDIGAGTGQHSYKMAEALEGTGRVYATDIDPRMTGYIAGQARERGLKNLVPVLVEPEGLDPFYAKHRFDLALVSDVYSFLEDRVAYFGRLRESLAPGGRVVVVSYPDRTHAFSREDFADWDGFLADAAAEPAQSPFGLRLGQPLRDLLAAVKNADACVRDDAVLDLLGRVVEGDLYTAFLKDGDIRPEAGLTPAETAYARVRVARLELTGYPARLNPGQLGISDRHMLAYVNKLVLIARYRARFVAARGDAPYQSAGLGSRWHLDQDTIAREMERAGYRLVERVPVVPFQAYWVFVDAKRPRTPPTPRVAPPPLDDMALALGAQQAKAPHHDRLLRALALEPGMRVLDLGAGTGQVSLRLARTLDGRLRVDAADTDARMTGYVAAQARERGLKNLAAFTVNPDGVQGLPADALYDRILLYDVYSYLQDRPAYFSRLRRRLAPGGRLVVAAYADDQHDFTHEHVKDWEGLEDDLRSEPPDTPLGRALAAPLARHLQALPPDACARRRAIRFHLNRVLDTELFAGYVRDGRLDPALPFTPEERDYAELLLQRAARAGVPGRRALNAVDGVEAHMVALLNRLILIARLRPRLTTSAGAPYRSLVPESEVGRLRAAVEAGGWRQLGREPFNLFQDVWTFADGGSP